MRNSDRPNIKIKINQHPDLPDTQRVDAAEALILLLPEAALRKAWPLVPYADVLHQRVARLPAKLGNTVLLATDLPNRGSTHVAVACIKSGSSAFELLSLARELAAAVLKYKPEQVMVCLAGLDDELAARVAEAQVAALLAASVEMPSYKSKPEKHQALRTIAVHGAARQDYARTLAEARGNALARFLTQLPPNELTPKQYRQRVARLARQQQWRLRFLDQRALQRINAGAFLAVAQGSPDADAGILHLRYTPRQRTGKAALALVGKGICFDTGGTNLKPSKYMLGMHEDMEGSAVALGTLLALTELKVDFPVDCWLALAQNHIGPKAYKQNDVVTACNGTTIEVIHTDAEGRMVLADTLALAGKGKPGLMIDYATLTGSCVAALGTIYSGAFSNRSDFTAAIIEAGRASGERVWPFPADADYEKVLESEIADIKQCSIDSGPDHIHAMRFLNRFVPESIPWIHVDLSAGNNKGGLAHIPTDVTGFGVRFTLNLLAQHKM
jgi:leucyl aminopeptidase